MVGCSKIEEYFQSNPVSATRNDILFPKQYCKDVARELFTQQARERDFSSEQDKHYFRHLQKYPPQRDFSNPTCTVNVPQLQNVLVFDSKFENGNLRKAAKVNNVEYNLWLENDHNTKGHTQWYYFKVVYKDVPLA